MLKIELDLTHHCIQTAINRLQNTLLSTYFKNKGRDKTVEDQLGVIEKALVSCDFPSLRSAFRQLAGGSDARIFLVDTGDDLPGVTIDGQPVDIASFVKK